MECQLDFPIELPLRRKIKSLYTKPPKFYEGRKIITKYDELILVFNMSLVVVRIAKDNRIIDQFRIEHPRLIDDLKTRLKEAKRIKGWIYAFGTVFLDHNGNLCLSYFNEKLSLPEMYRYKIDGRFLDTIRMNDIRIASNRFIHACDSRGHFFGINREFQQIEIFKESKSSSF